MESHTDIAIIGGGPTGAALALALRGSGLRVTVLEARAGNVYAPRPIALSHGSRLTLERLGVWQELARMPTGATIDHIHISQRGGFGRVALSAADAAVPHLGYVFDFNDIFKTLRCSAQSSGCDYHTGARATALNHGSEGQHLHYTQGGVQHALTAQLVVVADGGDIEGLSPPRVVDYAQHALTARVVSALPHRNTAYERFTPEGPLALLPFGVNGNEAALVWTLKPAHADALLHAADTEFLTALGAAFGTRLGEFDHVMERAAYPLTLRIAANTNPSHVVTIGNAAQTLHPVAGQGFNLGLRDAWELAQMLRTGSVPSSAPSLNVAQVLRRFRAARKMDRGATIAVTHGLVHLFSNDFLPANLMRGAAMTALGCIAPVKNFVARRMIFGARG